MDPPGNALRNWIITHLDKSFPTLLSAFYPFPFKGSRLPESQFTIDSPIVNHQLVCSESVQILSFLVMDLFVLSKLSKTLFPKQARADAVKLIVSANNEILNAVSSKLGAALSRSDVIHKIHVTPPIVWSHSKEDAIFLDCSHDSLVWEFTSADVSFKYAITAHSV